MDVLLEVVVVNPPARSWKKRRAFVSQAKVVLSRLKGVEINTNEACAQVFSNYMHV